MRYDKKHVLKVELFSYAAQRTLSKNYFKDLLLNIPKNRYLRYITALASAKVAIFSPLQRRVPERSNKFFWFLAKNRIFERPYLRF